MKKVLFVATVDSHILAFHIPYLKYFKENRYEVYVATNSDGEIPFCDKKIKLSIERSPLKIGNLKAIKQLKKIIEEEKFDLIHCHTPMGSVVTRLAAKKAREKYNTRVIYTAHGFHFYKGAPLLNWLIYYTIEKYLSKYTDCLITINQEDYDIAKSKFKASQIELVHGVGVDKNKFNFEISKNEKHELRESLGLKDDDFVILYVAELIHRKNHTMLINSVKEILNEANNIKLLLAGNGELTEFYQNMIKALNLEENVHLLGFRKDVPNLMQIANLYVSTSKQEGLPVNIMEAMADNLPIIATNCRGNRDLIIDKENGYLISIGDIKSLKDKILYIYNNYEKEKENMNSNIYKIQPYLLENVMEDMKKIYSEISEK